jgi:hypothetical protein
MSTELLILGENPEVSRGTRCEAPANLRAREKKNDKICKIKILKLKNCFPVTSGKKTYAKDLSQKKLRISESVNFDAKIEPSTRIFKFCSAMTNHFRSVMDADWDGTSGSVPPIPAKPRSVPCPEAPPIPEVRSPGLDPPPKDPPEAPKPPVCPTPSWMPANGLSSVLPPILSTASIAFPALIKKIRNLFGNQ